MSKCLVQLVLLARTAAVQFVVAAVLARRQPTAAFSDAPAQTDQKTNELV